MIANSGIRTIYYGEFYRDERIFRFAELAGIQLVDQAIESCVVRVFDRDFVGSTIECPFYSVVHIRGQAGPAVLPFRSAGAALPHSPYSEASFYVRKYCNVHFELPF